MTTCRDVAAEALRALKALAPGDDMVVDEGVAVLLTIQDLLLELHEARGPLTDVDVTADRVTNANERVRVQSGSTVTVTLPNAVSGWCWRVDDYGFTDVTAEVGSTGAADGRYRQPRDGERVEIVGVTQALYFYRSDLNTWASVYALALDSTFPLNATYRGHFAAKVAQRLIDTWPALYEPTPNLAARIGRANSALYLRVGVRRDPVRAEYF